MNKFAVIYENGDMQEVEADEFATGTIEINKKLYMPFFNYNDNRSDRKTVSIVQEEGIIAIIHQQD